MLSYPFDRWVASNVIDKDLANYMYFYVAAVNGIAVRAALALDASGRRDAA